MYVCVFIVYRKYDENRVLRYNYTEVLENVTIQRNLTIKRIICDQEGGIGPNTDHW